MYFHQKDSQKAYYDIRHYFRQQQNQMASILFFIGGGGRSPQRSQPTFDMEDMTPGILVNKELRAWSNSQLQCCHDSDNCR